jgi:hypothetical protein
MIADFDEFLQTTSEAEKIAFLLIAHSGEIKSTRLQKLSLIVKALLDGKVPDTHGAYFFGGFSDDVDEGIESMRSEGYLLYDSGKGYRLTEDGKGLLAILTIKEFRLDDTVKKVTSMFGNLTDKQVTALTYKLFPELTTNSVIKEEMKRVGENLSIETFKLE